MNGIEGRKGSAAVVEEESNELEWKTLKKFGMKFMRHDETKQAVHQAERGKPFQLSLPLSARGAPSKGRK